MFLVSPGISHIERWVVQGFSLLDQVQTHAAQNPSSLVSQTHAGVPPDPELDLTHGRRSLGENDHVSWNKEMEYEDE